MVAWAQPQVVVGVHVPRSVRAPGGCHVAEVDSNEEPTVRSEKVPPDTNSDVDTDK